MKVTILGCGRVGARLAQLMEADGHMVSIIDSDPASFDRLPEDFKGQTVLGTGIDVDVLKSAGIETADGFAAVTNYDNTNIMASEVAKEIFGVKRVLARIYDPGREDMYHHLGLETICPTTLVSTTARDILSTPRDTTQLDTGALQMKQTAPLSPAVTARLAAVSMAATDVQDTTSAGGAGSAKTQTLGSPHTADEAEKSGNGRGLRGLFRPGVKPD